jgi:hypothetical protein
MESENEIYFISVHPFFTIYDIVLYNNNSYCYKKAIQYI